MNPTQAAARRAPIFAALGDPTRLQIVERLGRGGAASIATLTAGTPMSRQAVTKHLAVLAASGLVRDERRGREHVWSLEPAPLREVAAWASQYQAQWEARFDRLETFLQTQPTEDETP